MFGLRMFGMIGSMFGMFGFGMFGIHLWNVWVWNVSVHLRNVRVWNVECLDWNAGVWNVWNVWKPCLSKVGECPGKMMTNLAMLQLRHGRMGRGRDADRLERWWK